MSEAVRAILATARDRDATFSVEEVVRWRPGTFAALRRAQWLRRAEPARAVVCDACGDDHVEEVEYVIGPRGTPTRMYIACPENLRVPVPRARLRQWSPDRRAIASAVQAALGGSSAPIDLGSGLVWRIPQVTLAAGPKDLFLDFSGSRAPPEGPEATIRLTELSGAPSPEPALALADFVRVQDGRLRLDAARLRAASCQLQSSPSEPIAREADVAEAPFCGVRDRAGFSSMSRAEYDARVADPRRFDLFLDAVARRAWRREAGRATEEIRLTDGQLDILVDIVRAGQPVSPIDTPRGKKCFSAQSARKLFDRARERIDVRDSDSEYTYFRVVRSSATRYETPCQFDPPAAAQFCVIWPQ